MGPNDKKKIESAEDVLIDEEEAELLQDDAFLEALTEQFLQNNIDEDDSDEIIDIKG